MREKTLISVIMNCHNGETFLEESLKSLFAQSYENWELIFWDNLSTDNSKKILKKFNDKRIKYYLSDNFTNLYEARNLAIEKASGKYISFLDTDDLWTKDKLKKQLSADIIGRGGAWLDTGSIEDFYKTSAFVSAIENRQGFKIACLEEIALLNGWINKKKIKESIRFYGNC